MPLDYIFTRTYVLESDTYQNLCPWIIHLLTRTNVLGSSVYLPGPMSLDYTSTYQDLRPWIICIFARTYVLGSYTYVPGPIYVLGLYIYLPRPMSFDCTYTYQDLCPWNLHILSRYLCPWIICILTRSDIYEKTKVNKLKTNKCTEKTKHIHMGRQLCVDR